MRPFSACISCGFSRGRAHELIHAHSRAHAHAWKRWSRTAAESLRPPKITGVAPNPSINHSSCSFSLSFFPRVSLSHSLVCTHNTHIYDSTRRLPFFLNALLPPFPILLSPVPLSSLRVECLIVLKYFGVLSSSRSLVFFSRIVYIRTRRAQWRPAPNLYVCIGILAACAPGALRELFKGACN